jgi:hypothetical protein
VKHKALAAFHQIIDKFEKRFPNRSGSKSVSVSFNDPESRDEMKAKLFIVKIVHLHSPSDAESQIANCYQSQSL